MGGGGGSIKAANSGKFLKDKLVARDGIAQHYTSLTIPITGVQLDPRLDMAARV